MKMVPNSIINTWSWVRALSTGMAAALIGTSYLALILAECHRFSLLPCLIFAILTASIASWIAQKRQAPSTRPEIAAWLLIGMVALGSLLMTAPPGEMLLGGWDPGVYIHTAAAIARDGGLQIPAQDVEALPASARAFLFKDVSGSQQPFQGMFRIADARLSPQFMHLYPSLLAIGYAMTGVWGALMVNPLLNVFAICFIYWFSSKIVGPKWALLAAFLLAINPAQVWQAKFSTAEILTQILLLIGFGTLIEFTKLKSSLLPAALSGAVFGLAFLARYDTLLIIVPTLIFLILAHSRPEQRSRVAVFLLTLALIGVHAWLHMRFIATCYRPLPGIVFPLLQLSLITAICLLATTQTGPGRQMLERLTRHTGLLRISFSCGFIGFLIFAWYIRPHLTVDGRVLSAFSHMLASLGRPHWLASIGGDNALNIQYLTAIFGRFGLLAGCLGIMIMAWRLRERGSMIWLLASVFTLIILVSNVFNDHFMMWVSRRFVPVVIPLIVVGIVVATKELYERISVISKPFSIGLSAAAVITLSLLTLPNTYKMASTRDWPGLCNWYNHLAQKIPPRSVVYCDQPGFAAPLRFMYGIRAFEFYGDISLSEFLEKCRLDLDNRTEQVLILTTRQQPRLTGLDLHKLEQSTLQSHIQIQPRYSIPDGVKERGGEFSLYRVSFPDSPNR